MSSLQIVGRRSSLFTRLPLIFAETLRVPYTVAPIADMTELSSAAYADNPALKLPALRIGEETVFGALNICRTIAEHAAAAGNTAYIVWPEDLHDSLARNAQELVWHGMAAQVQLVMGTVLAQLPADNIYFLKSRRGLEGCLRWLDSNAQQVIAQLPAQRDLSVFETSLLCLVEHLQFRSTVSLSDCASLLRFARDCNDIPTVRATGYRFD